jgi:hypothetical protein
MPRASRTLLFAALASLPVLAAFAAQTHVPANSVWKLNVAASDFAGGPGMKSDTFTMLVDTAKMQKFTDVMVDDAGNTVTWSWSGPADGTMHAVVGVPGMKYSTNAAADFSEETLPDGTSIVCSFSLSDDGKKYTDHCNVTTKDHKNFMQVLVYDLAS